MTNYLSIAVIHLGNVFFHRRQIKNGMEGVEIGSLTEVKWISWLLQLNSEGLIRALTNKITVSQNSYH